LLSEFCTDVIPPKKKKNVADFFFATSWMATVVFDNKGMSVNDAKNKVGGEAKTAPSERDAWTGKRA
jgi:hypothetical protein